MTRLNCDYFIKWGFIMRRLEVRFSWRRPSSLMGRFGGGWNWKLGVQLGGRTIIFSLLVAELVLSIRPIMREVPHA